MKRILKALKIVQIVSNEERHANGYKRLGKGFFSAYRLNPYNPLSYALLVVAIPTIFVVSGFKSILEVLSQNPFTWY